MWCRLTLCTFIAEQRTLTQWNSALLPLIFAYLLGVMGLKLGTTLRETAIIWSLLWRVLKKGLKAVRVWLALPFLVLLSLPVFSVFASLPTCRLVLSHEAIYPLPFQQH